MTSAAEASHSNDAEHVTWIPYFVAYRRMYPLFVWARASQEWNVLCVMSPIQAEKLIFIPKQAFLITSLARLVHI